MPVQLPQNVSHLVSSFLGAIGYELDPERFVLFDAATF